jgi:putative aminopeptidase FrvX
MPVPKFLDDLLKLPTATFVESAIMNYIRSVVRRLPGVSCRSDRFGNLVARYGGRRAAATPLVFAAHTDHPGFVAHEMLAPRKLRAAFRGYVETPYFPGAGVRFWSGGRWEAGRVVALTRTVPVDRAGRKTSRPEEVVVRVRGPVQPGAPGMWNLPDPMLKGDRLLACAHDDLAGVAAMLALLSRLSRRRAAGVAYCLFTRAEELGFIGAIGAAKALAVPKSLPIIAIETSKELPHACIGAGPILRVGDRMSVFTPDVTAFCGRVADNLAKRRRSFAFQRKLMDGGSCESTAYVAYGYRATGVCLALGNYHNMDTERGKIAPEYISLRDWQRMVDWFEALVLAKPGYIGRDTSIRANLDQRFRSYATQLKASVGTRRRPR